MDMLFLKILLLDVLLMGEQDNVWPWIRVYSAQNNNQIWQLSQYSQTSFYIFAWDQTLLS